MCLALCTQSAVNWKFQTKWTEKVTVLHKDLGQLAFYRIYRVKTWAKWLRLAHRYTGNQEVHEPCLNPSFTPPLLLLLYRGVFIGRHVYIIKHFQILQIRGFVRKAQLIFITLCQESSLAHHDFVITISAVHFFQNKPLIQFYEKLRQISKERKCIKIMKKNLRRTWSVDVKVCLW